PLHTPRLCQVVFAVFPPDPYSSAKRCCPLRHEKSSKGGQPMSTIIKHKEFPKFKSWTMDLCGRPLTIEVGKVAELASASAMVKYGDTTVLVAVTVSPRPRDGIDFFPLSVEFEEKLYAVGRIPGSFMRREGRPSLPA